MEIRLHFEWMKKHAWIWFEWEYVHTIPNDKDFSYQSLGPSKCAEISSLKSVVPTEIWDASNLYEDYTPIIGTSIDFKCPENLKLELDNDGFGPFDDKLTVLCSTRKTFDVPKKTSEWSKCVNFCPQSLPYVPLNETGLIRVLALNTVPAGQFGIYECIDSSLGVNQVLMKDFHVIHFQNDCFG